jgi:hypothetical protein
MTDTAPSTDHEITPSATAETVLIEAVGIIDGALAQMLQRELVSTGEVADLLLDMRSLLTSAK